MPAGEYGQPNPRVTVVNCPVVDGYATARLVVNESNPSGYTFGGSGTGPYAYEDNATLVTAINTGKSAVSFQLKETTDYGVSGARTGLGSVYTINPEGRVNYTVTPAKKYLEVYGVSGTLDGQLRLQLQSKLTWGSIGFAKSDTFYPTKLWQVTNVTSFGSIL